MRAPKSAGGWHALGYVWHLARRVGAWRLWLAMRTRNACKTCALGMGGQKGGMVNEQGRWPEVCKKSLQAMAADLQDAVPDAVFAQRTLAEWQACSPRELETAGRLTRPLLWEQGADRFQPVSWEKALSLIVGKLATISPEQAFFYFSGRSSNEAGFLLSILARLYGSNHVNNCSYYCHQASGAGLTASLGTGTATVQVEDIEGADLFFLIGGNPASNHPRLMTHLLHMKRRGGRVVVINPVRETGLINFRIPSDIRSMLFGSKMADEYLQPDIGGDIALLTGMAKAVLAEGGQDSSFIESSTSGFSAFRQLVEATAWDEIETNSGCSRSDIERIAKMLCASRRAIFSWTMGITHHEHGVENVQWIVNLALLTGMVGKASAGLLPIRGHSNIQGIGTVGVSPELKPQIAERYTAWAGPLPSHQGKDTMECMEAAQQGDMKFGMALGGNLYGSNPDSTFAGEALGNLDLMVYLSTSLNTGHIHGRGKQTLILPVLARDEEPYQTTQESMFSFVRLSDGGKPRHMGPMSEVDLIADIGGRLFEGRKSPIDWDTIRDTNEIRRLIARLIPELEQVKSIGATKLEFQIPGRSLYDGKFPTPSRKAEFHAHPIRPRRNQGTLQLMTVRSEGQFNTVVYEEEDFYRGQERRDVILMNEDDIHRLGLKINDPVTVASDTGKLGPVLVRSFAIKAGNVLMYYPEANVLVPRFIDAKSKTPAFKSVAVIINKSNGSDDLQVDGDRQRRVGSTSPRQQAKLREKRPGLKTC